MKRILFSAWLILTITAAVALSSALAVMAQTGSTGTLIVKITQFKSSEGVVMVSLANSEEGYKTGEDKALAKGKAKIEGGEATVAFPNLPFGGYAVSLYQDVNANGKLDKNIVGIPSEPYAFSNNARGAMGKPGYDQVRFELKEPSQTITITMP
jgi:uncharacterized protein (DUF2141 family)